MAYMDKKGIFLVIIVAVAALVLGYFFGTKGKKTRSIVPEKESVSSNVRISVGTLDYNEIITYNRNILQKNPNDARALADIGDAYFGLQRFQDAIDVYKRVIATDPKDIDSCNDLGLSLHYTGKSEEALKYIDECIKGNPDYQRIYLTKGFILSVNGKKEEARDAWERAYNMNPVSEVGKAAQDFLAQNRQE
ncbi:MAG: hypothetical protein A2073_06705 [Deltaproteobacteria bacterium GWC2_42_11]|nr:MAG: hypothetical protein A2073_06705 [Deltaproteobacteria bacterium GWC2_42_11]HBO83425.1 hypothetical protein [Deltaproteobacteria bacterium]